MFFVKLKLYIKQFLKRDGTIWKILEKIYSLLNNIKRLKGGLGSLPDFLIIGVQKGGTTSLYHYLIQHPSILPAAGKELEYFSFHYEKSLSWYKSFFPFKFIKKLKSRKGKKCLTCEASTHYLHYPIVSKRIKKTLPDVKIIILLRNPVDRAYSNYNHAKRNKEENLKSFEEAIEREQTRLGNVKNEVFSNHDDLEIQPDYLKKDLKEEYYNYVYHAYLSRGEYAKYVSPWMNFFPDEQLLIVKSEDLFEKPEQTTNKVFEFLGLKPVKLKKYHKVNKGSYRKRMKEETKKKLEKHFKPLNKKLYDLLNRDFGW